MWRVPGRDSKEPLPLVCVTERDEKRVPKEGATTVFLASQLTSTIFLREIRKPPDVAQADGVADGGEDEGKLGIPGLSHLLALLGGLHEGHGRRPVRRQPRLGLVLDGLQQVLRRRRRRRRGQRGLLLLLLGLGVSLLFRFLLKRRRGPY